MNSNEALSIATDRFIKAGIPSAVLDAEVLLAYVLGMERYRLLIERSRELSPGQCRRFVALAERRLSGEPVAYLVRNKEFYSLDFLVTPAVLIPRPETEILVDLALYYAPQGGRLLDLGTGSGAIAVSVKHARRDLAVYATDISKPALAVARRNCARHLGRNAIRFLHGDLYGPLQGLRFDVILSNPPYVDPMEAASLQREIGCEPGIALFAEDRGLAVIERIIAGLAPHLLEGGTAIIEISPGVRDRVMDLAGLHGFLASTMADYAGMPRVAVLKRQK